ncbi:MAG: NYN domain-containing protein [Candidatus Omnitrophica bacterium]|nr:NYN domain-containing protein [Candidatus Omnitrophota bacterium]
MTDKISKPTAIIFIDYANIYYGLKLLGWDIDYAKLKTYFEADYEIKDIYYYVGQHSFKSYFDHHAELDRNNPRDIWIFRENRKAKKEVFKSLRRKGYRVKTKEISSIYDHTEGKHKLKCNFDVELTIDAIDRMNDYEASILISGDADFARLLQYLKERKKKTIALATREHFSNKLRKVANKTLNINGLRQELEYVKS